MLLLAANTAFNGFPLLGSVLARDGYAPKSLQTRGDRLVYSNGVIVLGLAAILLLLDLPGEPHRAHPALHHRRVRLVHPRPDRHGAALDAAAARAAPSTGGRSSGASSINSFGALLTGTVLLVVTVTKFTHGAWLVFAIGPVLYFLMLGVNRYYKGVERDIEVDPTTRFGADGDHAIVLVGRMQKPTLKALDYAIAARHESIEAVHCSIDDDATDLLEEQWTQMNISVPLRVIQSPYRDISFPLIKYIKKRRAEYGSEVITVYIPQYIVGHWWENLLHNHKARRIRRKLLLCHGVTVALVPWLLDSSQPAVRPAEAAAARPGPPRRAGAQGGGAQALAARRARGRTGAVGTRASDTRPVERQPAGKQ